MQIKGKYKIEIFRADGRIEGFEADNLVPDAGTEEVAKILVAEASSLMAYLAVGTGTTAVDMSDTVLVGELVRKAFALNVSSLNTLIQVATFGGASESLTGLALNESGIFNHAGSGMGELGSRLMFSGSAVTLAQSDIAKIEIVTTIGSHS